MTKFFALVALILLTVVIAHADTLVLKDGREYHGIVTKNGRGYVVFIGKRQFTFTEDEVQEWIKGDARREKPVIKPKPTSAPGATAKPRKGAPKTLEALERHGRDALASGVFRVARNAYFDLLLLNPHDPIAQEGEGLAYMLMGDAARGRQLLEDALTTTGYGNRSIALNTALANVRVKNSVRAARIIRDFLIASGDQSGEDARALDLLIVALDRTEGPGRNSRNFDEARRFAIEYQAKLQSRHPGLKRWGAEWITPAEEAQRKRIQKADSAAAGKIEAELTEQKQALAKANADLADLELKRTRGVKVTVAIDRQTREVDRLREIVNATELKLAATRGTAASAAASALALEPLLPGEETEATAVAMADPPAKPGDPLAVNTPKPAPAAPPDPAPTPTPAVKPPAVTTPPSPTPAPAETPPPATVNPPVAEPTAPRRREVVDYAAAFAVGPDLVITDAVVVEGASAIRLQTADGALDAVLLRKDDETGLALLRVQGARLPYVALEPNFAGGAIKCVSFPTVDLFEPSAEAITGTIAAPGANWSAHLDRHPRLPGGPLVAPNGRVVGVELASRDGSAMQVRAATVAEILQLLAADAPPSPGTARASDATVQIMATHAR